MITVVQGKLGSGKTYYVVSRVAEHLSRGGCVCTNLYLDLSAISNHYHRNISSRQYLSLSADDTPSKIPRGDFRGKGSRRTMIVLDEALNWFQSSQGSSKVDPRKESWSEWLRQSDKLGQDVFFIAQNFERASKWIRELAQVCCDIVALKQAAILGFVPVRYLFPPLKYCFLVRSVDLSSKQLMPASIRVYKKCVFAFYETSQLFGFISSANAYDSLSLWPHYVPPVAPLYLSFLTLAFCILCFVLI